MEAGLSLYSGNWGVARDYDTFLAGYELHCRQGTGRFVLWLNAVGHGAIESGRSVLYIGSARSAVHALCAERLKAPYIRVGIDDVNGCWQALEALARLSAASQGGDAAEMGGAKRSME